MDILTMYLLGMVLFLTILAFVIKSFSWNASETYPGPTFFKLVSIIFSSNAFSDMLTLLTDFRGEYGNRFKMQTGFFQSWIVFSDGKDIKEILSHCSSLTKGLGLKYHEPWLGQGLLTASGQKWKAEKKMSGPFFSPRNIRSLHYLIQKEAERMRICISGKAKLNQAFNIKPIVLHYTYRVGLAITLGSFSDSTVADFLEGSKKYSNAVTKRMFRPWYAFDFVWNRSRPGKVQADATKLLDECFKKAIQDAPFWKNPTDGTTYYELLKKYQAENPESLSDEDILRNLMTVMGAASNTTTATLQWTFLMLAINRREQRILQEEIDQLMGYHTEEDTQTDLLSKLVKMEAFIYETLRLFPTVDIVENQATETIVLSDGSRIEAGQYMFLMIGAPGTDPKNFPQPAKFDMDRFSLEKTNQREKHTFLPFSVGPRSCIGSQYAIIIIKTAIMEILSEFSLECVNTVEEIGHRYFLGMHPKNAIMVTAVERVSKAPIPGNAA